MRVCHSRWSNLGGLRCKIFLWWYIISICTILASRPAPIKLGHHTLDLNSTFATNATAGYATHEGPEMKTPIAENNITCIGNAPDLRLPLLEDGFDPNAASMQQLCAKTQYNGGKPGQHAGAYCWTRPGTRSYNNLGNDTTGDVGFDLSPQSHASSQLQNPRFLLACFYRCFCNYGLEDSSVQPKSKYSYFRTSMTRSLFSYELQLDVNNDFTTPRLLKRGKQGGRRVKSTRVPERPEISQVANPSAKQGREYISLDPENEIKCRGDLPSFLLPAPYTHSDFHSLQELCATQMNGGNIYANAGGYCHRSRASGKSSNTVWFSDDQTPRLDWTWGGGNFFASASIRFVCWRRCACSNVSPTRDNATTSLWSFVHGHALSLRPDGAVVVKQEIGPVPPGGQRETVVLLPQHGPDSASGTCGVSGKEFCPQAWPQEIYGKIPREPPDTTDIVISVAPTNDKMVCGNTCTDISDCSSSGTQLRCSCALPSAADARTLGLDPVAPVAVCLALFASTMQRQSPNGKRALLGGMQVLDRNVSSAETQPPYVDSQGLRHMCKCNSTFVSDTCCISNDVFM